MKFVTYYERATGRIVGSAMCDESDVEINKPNNCDIAEGIFEGDRYYFVDGVPMAMPESPGKFYVFDYASRTWLYKKTPEMASAEALDKRNLLLQQSDWTDTASAPLRLGEALYTAWQVYRQALRDVPAQAGYPQEVVWPNPPA